MSILDRFKRKKETDKRILEKQQEIEERRNQALKENRYSAFDFDCAQEALAKCVELNDYEKYEFFYNILTQCDEKCKFTSEVGSLINDLMKDENQVGAIHRTYVGEITENTPAASNEILHSIMEDGLINNGHLSYGGQVGTPSLTLTTTSLTGIGDLVNLFSSYKHNNAVVLLKFPKELVGKRLEFTSSASEEVIYEMKDGMHYIKPEYILGVIIKGKEKDTYFTREEILNQKESHK